MTCKEKEFIWGLWPGSRRKGLPKGWERGTGNCVITAASLLCSEATCKHIGQGSNIIQEEEQEAGKTTLHVGLVQSLCTWGRLSLTEVTLLCYLHYTKPQHPFTVTYCWFNVLFPTQPFHPKTNTLVKIPLKWTLWYQDRWLLHKSIIWAIIIICKPQVQSSLCEANAFTCFCKRSS